MVSERCGYVYILANKTNTVLYIGVSTDLIKRVFEHKEKLAGGFTKKYNLNKLVYYEIFEDIVSAVQREKQLKGWVRRKKDTLINELNPSWNDLYGSLL
jgi:putative endonuclease